MPATLEGTKPALKYLFTATFQNGTEIKQTQEDHSKFFEPVIDEDGEEHWKSAFSDVLQYEVQSPLIKFSLKEAGILGLVANEWSVDLVTGKFSLNGVEFDIADQKFIPTQPLRIVYFRETRKEKVVNTKTREILEERHYINRYFIGWQTEWQGKNYQCTIGIDGK